jgi:hypothetical protein
MGELSNPGTRNETDVDVEDRKTRGPVMMFPSSAEEVDEQDAPEARTFTWSPGLRPVPEKFIVARVRA